MMKAFERSAKSRPLFKSDVVGFFYHNDLLFLFLLLLLGTYNIILCVCSCIFQLSMRIIGLYSLLISRIISLFFLILCILRSMLTMNMLEERWYGSFN